MAVTISRGIRAIRTPKWKLISKEGVPAELYNLQADSMEQENLISRFPEITTHLQHRLDALVSAEAAGPLVDPEQWMREYGYW